MRRRVLMALVATLLVAPVWAAEEAAESCCCIQRGGQLYCPLAGRTVKSCCCESTATRDKDSADESKQSVPEARTRR